MKKLRFLILTFIAFSLPENYSQSYAQNIRTEDLKDIKSPIIAKNINDASVNSNDETKPKILKSLMFDNEEIDEIKKAIFSYKNGESYIPEGFESASTSEEDKKKIEQEQREKELSEVNERSRIFLGSALYISKEHWAIWLNKTKITSLDNKKENEFFVKAIDGNKVHILWTLSLSKWKVLTGKTSDVDLPKVNSKNQVVVDFILNPNQTFLLRYNSIIEGKNIASFLKTEEKPRKIEEKK